MEADVDVNDIEKEDGSITVYVSPTDLHKAQEAINAVLGEIEYDVLAIKMLPHEYVELNDADKELFNRLLTLLDDVDDVNEVFHNVIL